MRDACEAVVVWFRDDLRVADNPALSAAIDGGRPVAALFVLDDESPGIRPLGGAARWWLHHSLEALAVSLDDLGVPLILRRGPAATEVPAVVEALGATAVHWNRRYGGPERAVDAGLKEGLRGAGLTVESHAATLLFEPWTISTRTGDPYSVFTPFWRACMSGIEPRQPLPAPAAGRPADVSAVDSLPLAALALRPTRPDWAGGLREAWTPGEASARRTLDDFLADGVDAYAATRDTPSSPTTSRLSPHVRWGEISPYQVWHAAQRARGGAARDEGIARFLTEIGWREFAWHTLYHFPDLATRNWRGGFDHFPWPRLRPTMLRAWQEGRTGFRLVDAGMRELWRTGWMHNRVRMVTASFLTKNLLIDWRRGEQWFWDTLVDADAASNPFNWQWVAGSGADAAPYFRVFSPELQARRFDPDDAYVRDNIAEWGTDDYPEPILDLAATRAEALAAYALMRGMSGGR